MISIIAGCYEEQVLGYVVKQEGDTIKAERKFGEHSHRGCVKCIAPGPLYIASGSIDETICVYDIESNTEVCTLQGHVGTVNALSFANDGTLVSCSDDGNICIWEVGEPACLLKTLKGHKGAVTSVSIHPSGKIAMSTSVKDGSVRTWNLLAGRSLYVKNMRSSIKAELVRWSSDGSKFILVSDSKIAIYSLESTKCCVEFPLSSPVLTLEYLPGYDVFAAGDGKGFISFFTASQSQQIHKFKAHSARIKSLFPFAPPKEFNCLKNQLWIVSASSDESLKIWRVSLSNSNTEPVSDIKEELLLEISTGARLTSVSAWYPGMIKSYKKSGIPSKASGDLKVQGGKSAVLQSKSSNEKGKSTLQKSKDIDSANHHSSVTNSKKQSANDESLQKPVEVLETNKLQKRKSLVKKRNNTKKSKLNIADLL